MSESEAERKERLAREYAKVAVTQTPQERREFERAQAKKEELDDLANYGTPVDAFLKDS